jgi:hypothetical protein
MSATTKNATQARLTKESAERDAKMATQKSDRLAVEGDRKKLEAIGDEIKVRVGKIDHLGGKAVDMFDSINHLLADAEKLCGPAEITFEDFKKTYCPEFGRSWTYELLALQEGRKSLEEIRAATRKRVARHRANVTDKPSVTSDPAEDVNRQPSSSPTPVSTGSPERDIDAVKAAGGALAGEPVDEARKDHPSSTTDAPAAAKSSAINAADIALEGFTVHVLDLIRRIAKHPAKRFAGTAVPGDELLKLGEFFTELRQIKSSETTSKALQ